MKTNRDERGRVAPAQSRVAQRMRGYEGSPADKAKDKREAAKRGISLSKWEKSAADKRMDAKGGK
jgi:hypothetical protein